MKTVQDLIDELNKIEDKQRKISAYTFYSPTYDNEIRLSDAGIKGIFICSLVYKPSKSLI